MRLAPTGKTLAIGLFGLVVAAGSFGACASGSQGPGGTSNGGGGSTSTSTNGGGGAGGQPIKHGQLGSACKDQSECDIGKCTDLGDGKFCSTECPPACPGGLYCGLINGKTLCIPEKNSCTQCSDASPCGFASERCLTAPAGDNFCAVDCTTDGRCPNGFECVDGDKYEKGGSGSGGGDTTSSSSSTSSSHASSSASSASSSSSAAGTGGSGGAGGGSSSGATKFCVPNSGSSCPCDDKRDGVSRSCDVKNTHGSCSGSEVCDADSGKFVNCSAKTPKKEVCNGKDDNCDDAIDEGDPNDLCSSMGAPPQHANWQCKDAACSLGKCDAGWANYPPGPPTGGCQCKVDAAEPNDNCAQATNLGNVSDSGSSILLTGSISSDTDVDVYSFNSVDSDEGGTNSYHVKMVFTEPATNNEFQMDVTRGTTCTDTPSGASANVTAYDWCVNGNNGASPPKGLAPCGSAAGQNHCADMSSKYFVRVHRKAGATKTCNTYKITVTAGGGTCDFTQTCP